MRRSFEKEQEITAQFRDELSMLRKQYDEATTAFEEAAQKTEASRVAWTTDKKTLTEAIRGARIELKQKDEEYTLMKNNLTAVIADKEADLSRTNEALKARTNTLNETQQKLSELEAKFKETDEGFTVLSKNVDEKIAKNKVIPQLYFKLLNHRN